MKKVVLSGMRPTGRLHLGHLVGGLENFLMLQKKEEYQCYFFIADWHATTDTFDWSEINEYSREILLDWLAYGINPQKSIIFRQSRIPEHSELLVILSSITPVPWLTRCPSYKDKLEMLKEEERVSIGFLNYPLLQTADIIIYKANYVPVGEDQLPHLEITREIIRRFHHRFNCSIFPEPTALLTKIPRLPGLDGRKMSKSFGNTIDLAENEESIKTKILSMITDPQRVKRSDCGHPEVCSVFEYHKVFFKDRIQIIEQDCKSAKIGCVECKNELSCRLINLLEPFRRIRKENIDTESIFTNGEIKAKERAKTVLNEVKQTIKVGI
ncbi:MAG: tryptophan--tRNA ligase [Candidatus Hydrogenedentota bacterium]